MPEVADVGSRHVPAAVKRAVVARDGGRCTFVGEGGRQCTATALLEFHHEQAFARGGSMSVGNVFLRCAAHNRYEGELEFPGVAAAVRRRRSVNDRGSRFSEVDADAISGLCNLGFGRKQAREAVAWARRGDGGGAMSLEQLLREALRGLRVAA